MAIEREVKFRLPDRLLARRIWEFLGIRPKLRHVRAIYFDSTDQRLRSLGVALRVRRIGRRWVQTLKARYEEPGGFPARYEWEVRSPGGQLSVEFFPCREILKKTGLDLPSLEADLRPLFRTSFDRSSAVLCPDGETRVEVCVDIGRVEAGRSSALIQELELEVVSGSTSAAMHIAEDLLDLAGLKLDLESKAQRGYLLAAGERTSSVKASRPDISAEAPLNRALALIVHVCTNQIVSNSTGVLCHNDPEFLHQMRIGFRRLRSGVRAFRGVIDPVRYKDLVRDIKASNMPIGAARDWDVCEHLVKYRIAKQAADEADFRSLIAKISRRARHARSRARTAVGAAQFQRTLLTLMRWQDELVSAEDLDYPQGDRARSSRAFGVRTVRRMEKKLVGLGERVDRLDNARMHALRVQLKRLRYVTEFFALFFRQKDMLPYLRCVSALQDILGELNDFVTVRRLLSEFEEPENDIAVSSVRRWMTERERSLRRKLPRAWRILVRARLCH